MLVLLVPTWRQYLTSNIYQFNNIYTIHTNLSKGVELRIYKYMDKPCQSGIDYDTVEKYKRQYIHMR
jgi:hypothetical protein